MSLKRKIKKSIQASRQSMFFCADFKKFSSDTNQIRRALRELASEEVIIRSGGGSYVKTKDSRLTKNKIPTLFLEEMGRVYLEKKGVRFSYPSSVANYNAGRSTQIPSKPKFITRKKVSAKVGYKGNFVVFEKG